MDSGGITTQQVVLRAQIVCGATQGQSDKATASALGIRRETARCGAGGVRAQGIGCVWEIAAGRGRKRTYPVARVGQWIEATPQTKLAARHTGARAGPRARGQ
jgi:hypothetical protein